MKTASKYNRSEIMKKAWSFFRQSTFDTFSECLSASWRYAKIVEEQKAISKKLTSHFSEERKANEGKDNNITHAEAMREYYSRPVGSYYGD